MAGKSEHIGTAYLIGKLVQVSKELGRCKNRRRIQLQVSVACYTPALIRTRDWLYCCRRFSGKRSIIIVSLAFYGNGGYKKMGVTRIEGCQQCWEKMVKGNGAGVDNKIWQAVVDGYCTWKLGRLYGR